MKIRTLLSVAALAIVAHVGLPTGASAAEADVVVKVKCYNACVTTGTGKSCQVICVTGV